MKKIIINNDINTINNDINTINISDITSSDLIHIIQNHKIIGIIANNGDNYRDNSFFRWDTIILNNRFFSERTIENAINLVNKELENCEFYVVNR